MFKQTVFGLTLVSSMILVGCGSQPIVLDPEIPAELFNTQQPNIEIHHTNHITIDDHSIHINSSKANTEINPNQEMKDDKPEKIAENTEQDPEETDINLEATSEAENTDNPDIESDTDISTEFPFPIFPLIEPEEELAEPPLPEPEIQSTLIQSDTALDIKRTELNHELNAFLQDLLDQLLI